MRCHTQACGPLCGLQKARARVLTRASPSSLASPLPGLPSSDRKHRKRKTSLRPGDAAVETPSRCSRPQQLWPAVAGCGALPELCPAQAGLRVQQSRTRQSQPEVSRSSEQARDPARNQLFPCGAPCAPPCEGIPISAATTCGPRDRACRARTGPADRWHYAGPACRSQPRTRKLPGGRARKPPPPALEAAAAPAKGTGRGIRGKALVPRVAACGPQPEAFSPERRQPGFRPFPPTRTAPPHPRLAVPGARSPEGAGSAGGRSQDPREAQGRDAALQPHLEPQDLGR